MLPVVPDGRSSVVLDQPCLRAGGVAVAADGRVFVAASGSGTIGVVDPRSRQLRAMLPEAAGYPPPPNDLVLDGRGGYSFTDF